MTRAPARLVISGRRSILLGEESAISAHTGAILLEHVCVEEGAAVRVVAEDEGQHDTHQVGNAVVRDLLRVGVGGADGDIKGAREEGAAHCGALVVVGVAAAALSVAPAAGSCGDDGGDLVVSIGAGNNDLEVFLPLAGVGSGG